MFLCLCKESKKNKIPLEYCCHELHQKPILSCSYLCCADIIQLFPFCAALWWPWKGGASSAPSCLYEHMNYQERKGWLTLDFLKWRESQDESQTFTVTKRLRGCACLYGGKSFQFKTLFFYSLYVSFLHSSDFCLLEKKTSHEI